MKPSDIFKALDLAKAARSKGLVFNPMFTGDAGLGKSEICQAWVKEQQKTNPKFGFLDIRLAYFESPDFIGIPVVVTNKDGTQNTIHIPPVLWPHADWEGLILFDEPNRANASTLNGMMQILTDRVVNGQKLPKGAIFAACVNPDNNSYDVNSMDTALRDRFELFEVNYDKTTFLDFMKTNEWQSSIIQFVESGNWTFVQPDQIGTDGKYVSPRTWSKLNTALSSGVDLGPNFHFITANAVLGKAIGTSYHKFIYNTPPVTVDDLITNEKASMKKLKEYSDQDNYRGELLLVTVQGLNEAFLNNEKVTLDLIVEVAKVIPTDKAVELLNSVVQKSNTDARSEKKLSLMDLVKDFPDLKAVIKMGLRRDETEVVTASKTKKK